MAVYEIALTPLLKDLATCYPKRDPKVVAFADNLTSAGSLSKPCSWWKDLLDVGIKYEYFLKLSKTIFIVKPEYELKAGEIFHNTNIKITSSGQRYLGTIIGSGPYPKEYLEETVSK